jgi:hypothetical protein
MILTDVLVIAFEHMKILAKELSKIDLKKAEEEKNKEVLDRAQLLSHVLTLINDVIHPAHDTALSIFPDANDFVDYCIKNQRLAIEKKLISPKCDCYACSVNKIVK